MKLSEAKDILVTRLGWKDDKTVTGFVLSPANEVTNSGRFFQDEHSIITLLNIKDCQPIPDANDAALNDYLTGLKTKVVLQVLDDAFERENIHDDLLTLYPTAFDTAISLRMVVVLGELFMTSSRSNENSRITKEVAAKLNYDIFRDTVQKFANRSSTYKYSMGIATRYEEEILSVQRRFGTQKRMLKTITKR